MERQRVLVTGGAGFLRINLIRHLMARGYALASLDVEEFDYPERDRVEVIRGDIRDKSLLDRAMEGADYVVHTAAALPSTPRRHLHDGRRGYAQRARSSFAHRVKRVVRLLDGGLRDTGPPSPLRDGQARGRRPLRAARSRLR